MATEPESVWQDVGEGGVIEHEGYGRCVVIALWQPPESSRTVLWYVTVPAIEMKMFSMDCDPFMYRLILDPDVV